MADVDSIFEKDVYDVTGSNPGPVGCSHDTLPIEQGVIWMPGFTPGHFRTKALLSTQLLCLLSLQYVWQYHRKQQSKVVRFRGSQ